MICLPCIIFVRGKPFAPPNDEAYEKRVWRLTKGTDSFREGVKNLFTNWDFILMVLVYGFLNAMYNSLATILGILCWYYGYDSKDVSLFGLSFIISGLVASFIHAGLLDRYEKYKLHTIIISLLSLIGVVCVMITFGDKVIVSTLILAFMGFSVLPILSIGLTVGCQISYPVG